MNRGLATKPVAWFEPAQCPPSELAGPLFVNPDSTASPSLEGIRDPFLLHVLHRLNLCAWLQSEEAPSIFQKDLDSLFDIFGWTVINPSATTVAPYLPCLFTLNSPSLLMLCSLVYPGETPASWEVRSPRRDNQPTPLEPGAREPRVQLLNLAYSYRSQKEKLEAALASQRDTLALRFPALRSSDLGSVNTSPS